MSFLHCPKCGTRINGAVEGRHCGRMSTPYWKGRSPPPWGELTLVTDCIERHISKSQLEALRIAEASEREGIERWADMAAAE